MFRDEEDFNLNISNLKINRMYKYVHDVIIYSHTYVNNVVLGIPKFTNRSEI